MIMNNAQPNAGVGEVARATGAGAGLSVFAAKVRGNYSYNNYKVRVAEILSAGQAPVEIGGEFKATNLAESFTQQGQLAAGTYVLVCSTGDRNLFYAQP